MERKMIVKLSTLKERFSGRAADYMNRSRLSRSPAAIGKNKGAVGETTGCKQ